MSTVLVTGGSGFVGIHAVLQLLAAGHEIRTTVRRPDRQADVLSMLREGGVEPAGRLSFFTADLTGDDGWREAGVRRVVITSSLGAIGYGHAPRATPFDETDWTNLDGDDVQPYVKSKTLAEHAAWDFVAREGGGLELAVVNPVGIFGPVLGPDYSGSIEIVKSLLDGAMPAVPRIYFGLVDVRDVVDLHLRAMTAPEARGERFIAVAGETVSILDIANILRRQLGPAARRVPRFQAPDWLVRVAATGVPLLRAAQACRLIELAVRPEGANHQ